MKRRRTVLLLALIAVMTGVFAFWPRGPKEPGYQGKSITQWINDANDVGIFEQTDDTKAAMHAFGTNALPFLLSEFTRSVSPRRERIAGWVNSIRWQPIRFRDPAERMRVAGRGLFLLGTNAAPAIPALIPLLDDTARGEFAAAALREIGPPAIPALTAALLLTDNPPLARKASNTLYRIDPAAFPPPP